MAVGVRGTALISQAFSPEASDVGESPTRLSSNFALRFSFCSFVGKQDQMPRARLKRNIALKGVLADFCLNVLMWIHLQHENGHGKGALGLSTVAPVARRSGVVTVLVDVPCYGTWAFRVCVVWAHLSIHANCPECNENYVHNDAEHWYPTMHHKQDHLDEEHEHGEDRNDNVKLGNTRD